LKFNKQFNLNLNLIKFKRIAVLMLYTLKNQILNLYHVHQFLIHTFKLICMLFGYILKKFYSIIGFSGFQFLRLYTSGNYNAQYQG
jgi:hypothetical protein